jgi:hypothetical protein
MLSGRSRAISARPLAECLQKSGSIAAAFFLFQVLWPRRVPFAVLAVLFNLPCQLFVDLLGGTQFFLIFWQPGEKSRGLNGSGCSSSSRKQLAWMAQISPARRYTTRSVSSSLFNHSGAFFTPSAPLVIIVTGPTPQITAAFFFLGPLAPI